MVINAPDNSGQANVAEGAQTTAGKAGGKEVELTILMPCLNEAETLAVCIAKAKGYLERSGVAGEVVIADNGSTDGSQAIAKAAGARVIDIPVRGYGAALIGGVNGAYGKYVIMGDADDSYDFSNLDPFIAKLRGGADLVMGNRFKGGIEKGAMPPLHRYLGNPVLSFIGRLFFNIGVGDFHCGLRGFRRDSIQALNLRCTGMEYASEMVVKTALNGLKMEEAPTTLKPDGRSRAPHLKTWRDGWRHLRFLLLHSPKWLFAIPGATLLGIGLILSALTALGPVEIIPGVRLDYHTLIGACFFILMGVQLLLFGVLTRAYAASEGFLPQIWRFRKTLMAFSLERMLQIAAVLFIGGVGGVIWSFSYWVGLGLGDISASTMLRIFVPSLTAITVSIQIAASAFMASVFAIRR
jgi:glycosyltransferase involved in cell wall biosynthesis